MIHIRTATENDAKKVNDTYDYYIQNSTATYNEIGKTTEQRREEILFLLPNYPFFIAENEEGKYLGFACAEPFRTQTGYKYCAELTIYLSADAPVHQGIGKKLYEALLGSLKKQGFRTVYGVIDSENKASLALHQFFGFRQCAYFSKSGYKHGKWLDTVYLSKELNPFDACPAPLIPFSKLP